MIEGLGLEDVLVVNDFEAQALAIAALSERKSRTPWAATGEPHDRVPRRAWSRHRPWRRRASSMRSTSGSRFPAKAAMSISGRAPSGIFEIFPHLETIEGRISAEQILCGRGLVNLYRAICAGRRCRADLRGSGRHHLACARRNRRRRRRNDLAVFTYLGRVAGDMAMIFMARGGVYPVRRHLAEDSPGAESRNSAPPSRTRRRIRRCSHHPDLRRHPSAGSARRPFVLCAHARHFGVSTDGRRWASLAPLSRYPDADPSQTGANSL
jgi:glucokinase